MCLARFTLTFVLLIGYIEYILSNSTCTTGCKCSVKSNAAVCCLVLQDNSGSIPSWGSEKQVLDACDLNTSATTPDWPRKLSCLSTWRQLQIQLYPHSWPSVKPMSTQIQNSCTRVLRRLVVNGASTMDDGLLELNPEVVRGILFQESGVLSLIRLTVQQTGITKVASGFLDTLQAFELQELEIRRNPRLLSSGFGIGWLANAHYLKLLDLSRNSLTSIDLARWGLPMNHRSDIITLILSGNRIAYLEPRTFERLPNLVKLDLSNNLLVSLQLDVFHGLGKLNILALQGNQLNLPGLKLGPLMSLHLVLPELRQLKLSNNTLLQSTSDQNMHWWLTGECPKRLTEVHLEYLNSRHAILPDLHSSLPPVSWSRCPALTHLVLTQLHPLPCLTQKWLGLPSGTSTMPERFLIRPSSLQLCPPSTPDVPSQIFNDQPGGAKRIDSGPYLHSVNPITPIEKYTMPVVESSRDVRVVNLRGSDISLWLVLTLVILLLVAVVTLITWFSVRCLHRYYRPSDLSCSNPHVNIREKRRTEKFNHPGVFHGNFVYAAPIGSNSRMSSSFCMPLDLSVFCDDSLTCHNPHSLMHQNPACTNMHILSPTDSGMEDLTPMTMQQSLGSGTSPSSSHFSVPHCNVQMPLIPRPAVRGLHFSKHRTNSFTSLRSAPTSPSHALDIANECLLRSCMMRPRKLVSVAISTEDESLEPTSTLADLTQDDPPILSDNETIFSSQLRRNLI